jgi:hypothetical protein
MNVQSASSLLWRTILGLFCALDYFLFSTGNPSATFAVFGGWFEILFFIFGTVTVAYGVSAARRPDQRPYFFTYISVLVLLVMGLQLLSDRVSLAPF